MFDFFEEFISAFSKTRITYETVEPRKDHKKGKNNRKSRQARSSAPVSSEDVRRQLDLYEKTLAQLSSALVYNPTVRKTVDSAREVLQTGDPLVIVSLMKNDDPDSSGSTALRNHPAIPFILKVRCRDIACLPEQEPNYKRICYPTTMRGPRIVKVTEVGYRSSEDLKFLFIDKPHSPKGSGTEKWPDAKARAQRLANMFRLDNSESPRAFHQATGLLPCAALVECMKQDGHPPVWAVLFQLPPEIDPTRTFTLREMLDDTRIVGYKPSPVQRIKLACAIAESMLILHAMGLVHRSIRPDNVLVLRETCGKDSGLIGTPYLFGLEQVQGGCGQVNAMEQYPTSEPLDNLYVHPNLQVQEQVEGEQRTRNHQTLDDIYGFAVTLIEILLWQSFLVKIRGQWEVDKDMFNVPGDEASRDKLKAMIEAKTGDLKSVADKLVRIVNCCLACWEWPEAEGREEVLLGKEDFSPKEQTLQGIRFVVEVLRALRALGHSMGN